MASWNASCVALLLVLSTLLVLVQSQASSKSIHITSHLAMLLKCNFQLTTHLSTTKFADCTLSCGNNAQCIDGSCSCNQGSASPSGTDTDCISLTGTTKLLYYTIKNYIIYSIETVATCLTVCIYYTIPNGLCTYWTHTEPNPTCTSYDPSCIYCGTSSQGPCLRFATSITACMI